MNMPRIARGYRRRYRASRVEEEILTRYAERYYDAMRNGVSKHVRVGVVEEARRCLKEVSSHGWDSAEREPYEVRQWFNRWFRRQGKAERQRVESGVGEGRASEDAAADRECHGKSQICAGEWGVCESRPWGVGHAAEAEAAYSVESIESPIPAMCSMPAVMMGEGSAWLAGDDWCGDGMGGECMFQTTGGRAQMTCEWYDIGAPREGDFAEWARAHGL
jgi:hypothetical protein